MNINYCFVEKNMHFVGLPFCIFDINKVKNELKQETTKNEKK
jgi:hypothetical protein